LGACLGFGALVELEVERVEQRQEESERIVGRDEALVWNLLNAPPR
jgi:hypothetical protein